jgi:ligand-binding sensor protein
MYCSTCGVAVAQGLSFCNYCGAKLGGAKGESVGRPSEVKPELIVSAMVGLFSFMLMLVVEGVLIGLLLKGRRGAEGAGDAGRSKEQTTSELGEAQARALSEPVPSVTEHTTRILEPVYSERQSK